MEGLKKVLWMVLPAIVPVVARAEDPVSQVESYSKQFFGSASNITRMVIVFGLALAFIGVPTYIGLKTAYSNYQKQEQMMGAAGKINWTGVVAHGILAFIGGLLVVALVVGALDYMLGGGIFEAVKNFFTGMSGYVPG